MSATSAMLFCGHSAARGRRWANPGCRRMLFVVDLALAHGRRHDAAGDDGQPEQQHCGGHHVAGDLRPYRECDGRQHDHGGDADRDVDRRLFADREEHTRQAQDHDGDGGRTRAPGLRSAP